MDLQEVRRRYDEQLLAMVRETRYPSVPLMQRIEGGLREMDAAVQYVDLLVDKIQDRYPSLALVDRISTLLSRLEQFDVERQQREEQMAS
jgi:hypothetical protein